MWKFLKDKGVREVKNLHALGQNRSSMLPESVQSKINEATVIAVGPGARSKDGTSMPMAVSVGDRVMLPEYGGTSVKLGDDEFHVFRDEDIIGILK